MASGMKQRLRQFLRNEGGSASVESLFWIPLFVFFLVLVLDVSFIFFGKAQALRVIQDGNRALSVGRFDDTATTEQSIASALAPYAPNAEITSVVNDGVVTTTAKIPATDLMVVGTIPVFADTVVSITAQHFLEQ